MKLGDRRTTGPIRKVTPSFGKYSSHKYPHKHQAVLSIPTDWPKAISQKSDQENTSHAYHSCFLWRVQSQERDLARWFRGWNTKQWYSSLSYSSQGPRLVSNGALNFALLVSPHSLSLHRTARGTIWWYSHPPHANFSHFSLIVTVLKPTKVVNRSRSFVVRMEPQDQKDPSKMMLIALRGLSNPPKRSTHFLSWYLWYSVFRGFLGK